MRKALSLLLTLALLSALSLTALAEEPLFTDLAVVREADGSAAVDVEPTIPEAEEGPLANAVELIDESLIESPQPNAGVPAKLTLGAGETSSVKISGAKKYQSSNTKFATVSSKGLVKAVAKGSATITITMKKGDPLKVKVTVKSAPTKVTLDAKKLTLNVGESHALKAKLSSKSASRLTWKSSKKKVAQVDGNGVVTAIGAGTATITVSTFNKQRATCTVKVSASGDKVGVSMPTDEFRRWKQDGQTIKQLLKKAGMEADLRFAGNDPQKQCAQVEDMIDKGCSVLIVAPVDNTALDSAMKKARGKGVPVISYDRLITHSDAVSYYVTFSPYKVGETQGKFVESALKLKTAKGPFNIEFTTGDPDDWNAILFYQGAIDVLSPYIDSGKLKVLSGQVDFKKVTTQYWSTENAEARAKNILSSHYSGKTLHAWLCSNDTTAQGVIHALGAKYKGKTWPVVTGQDCDLENVRYILEDKQAMSVLKDTRILAARAVKMAGQILLGEKVDVNDTETYDNGAKTVPAFTCAPGFVTKSNYREMLIDTGLYSEEDLKG